MTARHLYVHVPFCRRRCSYCDFAIAVRTSVPSDRFVAGVSRELRLRQLASDDTLDTLYLGGGTPSLLGPQGVASLIRTITAARPLAPDAEVTIEANPEDATDEALSAWRAAGINRVSLGVQSFDENVLSWMHRSHGSREVTRAADVFARHGLTNWSLDLIYALPTALSRDLSRDIEQAIALRPSHISAYGLTIEQHTPLGRWRDRGQVNEAPDERYETEFFAVHQALSRAGYRHYEVSNFARGDDLMSRHNSSYWRGVDYLGLGPSAHGFEAGGTLRRWNLRDFAKWIAVVEEGVDPLEGQEHLTEEQKGIETVYLGLRTDQGLQLVSGDGSLVEPWIISGWAEREGSVLKLTPLGWLRLDALVSALTAHRSRY